MAKRGYCENPNCAWWDVLDYVASQDKHLCPQCASEVLGTTRPEELRSHLENMIARGHPDQMKTEL